jgi:hypothetical protein
MKLSVHSHEVELENPARINLISGPANVGKTELLETVWKQSAKGFYVQQVCPMELVYEQWAKLDETHRARVLEALRWMDARIGSIELVGSEHRSTDGFDKRDVIIHAGSKQSFMLQGCGIRRLLTIVSAITATAEGVVVIESLGAFWNADVYPVIINLLDEFTQDFGVTLYASVYDAEFILAAARVKESVLYRMAMINGKLNIDRLSAEEVQEAEEKNTLVLP